MKNKRNCHGAVSESSSELVKPPPLPLLCEISGALHLAQAGLMVDRLAGWQTKYR